MLQYLPYSGTIFKIGQSKAQTTYLYRYESKTAQINVMGGGTKENSNQSSLRHLIPTILKR